MPAKSKQQTAQSPKLHKPKITEATIRKLANSKSFDRGQQYYQNGAITNPTRQDNRIWADCYGSEVYQTSATLTAANVTDLRCSCPYDWGGACKHLVALLLTYTHQPKAFHQIPPLRDLLANHSRDDLLSLLDRVLQQHPDLLTSLEIAAETTTKHASGQPIDTSAYRRQIQRALRGDHMRTIAKLLEPSLAMAKQLEEAGDVFNAGRFYQILLSEITYSYEGELQEIDYDGKVACFAQDAAEGLGRCLADQTIAADTRQEWLNTLLEGILRDIDIGGIDFAAGAEDALITLATEAEWAILEVRIRQELSQLRSSWAQDTLAGLLADRLQHIGQDQASADIMLVLGSPERQALILVEQGKYDLAISTAKQHFQNLPGLVTRFADALVAAGEAQKALQYMTEEHNSDSRYSFGEWLANYYREQGDAKAALKFEEEGFLQRPWLGNYQRIHQLADSIGTWPRIRSRLIKHITEKKWWELLVEIAIYEQDTEQALKLLKNLGNYQQKPLKLKIVQISEPEMAIALYEELVHSAIEGKNRSAYQEAVRHLQAIQKLKKVAKTSKDWKQYIQKIRERYPTLKALQSELDQL